MSIQNSVATFSPGTGSDFLATNLNVSLSGASQATTNIPSTGTFTIPLARGRCRVKIYNGAGTSPTLVDLVAQASDGTNTCTFYVLHPNSAISLTSTAYADFVFPMLLDVSTAGGGASGSLIATGATKISFLTTLGGTSPTATGDFEVYAIG